MATSLHLTPKVNPKKYLTFQQIINEILKEPKKSAPKALEDIHPESTSLLPPPPPSLAQQETPTKTQTQTQIIYDEPEIILKCLTILGSLLRSQDILALGPTLQVSKLFVCNFLILC